MIAWAPVPESRRVPGGAVAQVMVRGTGSVRIPRAICPEQPVVYSEGRAREVAVKRCRHASEEEVLVIDVTGSESGRWLWIAPDQA